jgi:DNA-binding CsgD family transcriptional regulator
VVGVAVLDSRLRFRAINGRLAEMNGKPAVWHIGKKLRHVLGGAAPKVEAATDQVLQTGKPVPLDLTAELPSRAGVGHWTESFFPIRNVKGRVAHVAAVVLEITDKRDVEKLLNPLVGNLLQIRATLKTELQFHDRIRSSAEKSELFGQTIELAEKCIAMVRGLSEVPSLSSSSSQPQVQHGDDNHSRSEVSARHLSRREHGVLQLLADGKSNKEVGALLGISTRTAELYRARLMNKVQLHSLAHLVRFAVRNKIIEA